MRRGGSATDFRTNGQGDRNVTVAALLGKECAEDIIDVSHSSQFLQYTIAGMLTKPLSSVTARSVQMKKNRQKSFFLFINRRSVQCAPLKFAVDTIFANRDLVCSFVLLSLQYFLIEPSRIDVNVHPTKESVMFLEQNHIVEDVQKHIESLLHDIFDKEIAPRSINEICSGSQQLLTDSQIERIPSQAQIHFERINSNSRDISQSSSLKSDKKRVDHVLVRTDTHERRLDEFLVQKESISLENVEIVAVSSSQLDNVQYEERDESCRRLFSFTSLDKLRRSICTNASQSLRELFKSHTFVGCVSPEVILMQYSTALYLINAKEVMREMFYQNFVFSFGNFGSYKLSNGGASVAELYIIANNEDEGAQNASFVLEQHGAILDDYFSLRFERQLVSIPFLIDGYVPQLEGLPRLISDLVNIINWDDELLCFSGICRALAEFFVIKEEYCSGASLSGLQEKSIHWKRVLSDLLIPHIKTQFMPLENLKQKEVIRRLTDLYDLYKVFEKC